MLNKQIPIERVIKELEEYFSRDDLKGAEKHLDMWCEKAEEIGDWKGKLSVLNERIGYYRRNSNPDKALNSVKESFEMIEKHDIQDTISAGTIWLNGATTLKAFGKADESIKYFEKVSEVYKKKLDKNDYKYASLFNNMALSYVDLKEYEKANEFYLKALEIMEYIKAYIELAVTYTNMAVMYEKWNNDEDVIADFMMKALSYLNNNEIPRNGYYAFNCKKCAPTFGYFGFFLVEKDLNERADKIYAGN